MLTVTNDGKMPSQADIDHLFDRYHSGSTSEGGTGIGLALTKEIVELHGWQIGARLTDENTMEVWVDLH
jgi:signal transduction histidine kinase